MGKRYYPIMTQIVMFVAIVVTQVPVPPIHVPPKCEDLPAGDWEACDPPSTWDGLCFSMTSYWPFDEHGELVPWGGQANAQPWATANGHRIESPSQAMSFVAAPLPLVGREFCSGYLGCVPVHDTFGAKIYQAGGFWHDTYQTHVVPVDVFSPEIIHYLECDAEFR